jgi:integrase
MQADWADFVQWCVARDEPALPATVEAVVDYVAELAARRTVSTVERRLAAIRDEHRDVDLPSPTDDPRVRVEVTRLRWQHRKSRGRTIPLETRALRAMLDALPRGLVGARDRALLLVGYGAGLRPSELVALDVSDLVVVDAGLSVAVLRGRVVLPSDESDGLSAPGAWQRWVAAARLTRGPAFRAVDRDGRLGLTRLGEKSITQIVRHAAERAGLDDRRYSALSLRLGLVTTGTEG